MRGRVDRVLQLHLRFFQLLGLHSLPLSGEKESSLKTKMIRYWSGCLLFCYTVLAFICMCSGDKFLYGGDVFGRFNDGLKFAFAEIAVVSMYVEAIWKRKDLSRYWKLYATLAPFPADTLRLQMLQHWRFLAKIYCTLVLESVMIYLLFSFNNTAEQILLFWSTFQPFIYLIHLRNTQLVLHVELLRQQLFQLQMEVALLVEYSQFATEVASFVGFEEFMRRQVRQKQIQYNHIYELSNSFLHAFSFSMLTVFFMIYLRIIIDCYFIYFSYRTKIDINDYYLMVPALLEIPSFIYISHSCMKLVFHIAYQLHNIVVRTPALSLQVLRGIARVAIQNFSLQLLHQPVRLHSLGILTLDMTLLTRGATAICTYMLFTVQLMPKTIGHRYNLESSF